MIQALLSFYVVGVIFGFSVSLNNLFSSIAGSKIVRFLIDFLMLISWALVYFCVTLAYRDAQFRYTDLLVTFVGILTYIFTVYKPLNRILERIGIKLNKKVKKLSKKLKMDKICFKKLLHFNKK